ncbi:MAG: hypothetical protein H0T51_08460 [Pirellulales bacterium]|nr:hypothetical protein [Pirellulales bacterium]
MDRFLTCLLIMTLAVAANSSARAVTFFADNFESTAGPYPAEPNAAQAGFWWPNRPVPGHVINDLSPGAHGGANYLRISRTVASPEFGNTGSNGLEFDPQPAAGTPIHAEWWMNVNEGYASFGFNAQYFNQVQFFRPLVTAEPNGNLSHYSANVGDYVPTGLTYTKNVWQKYELDTVLGGSTAILKVDGASTTLSPPFGISPAQTINAVYGVAFVAAGPAANFFVDDVLVTAGVSESADFDVDGDVDGADFLTWQRGVGTTSGAAPGDGDANGDQMVDANDLDVWRSQFDSTPLAVSVPEPGSLACLLIASSIASSLRVTRRSVAYVGLGT